MIQIVRPDGAIAHHSKNLRGVLDHARRVGLVSAQAFPMEDGCGVLAVIFRDGCICLTVFHSFTVLCHWLRSRRSWVGVRRIAESDPF
jgi:hypothetical protein